MQTLLQYRDYLQRKHLAKNNTKCENFQCKVIHDQVVTGRRKKLNKKEYSFTYIRHIYSNLILIPMCFFVLILTDCLEKMDNNIVKAIYNLVAVVLLILIYNRISNYIFQSKGKINIIDSKQITVILGAKVTEIYISDIVKVILSINKQFNSNHIELIIKTTENKKIKIVSKRYFNREDLSNHAFINIFYDIKNSNSELCFESDFDGTFLTLERKNVTIHTLE